MDALPNELYFKCYKKLYIIEKHIAYNLKSDSSCNAIMPIDQKLLTVGSVICTAVMWVIGHLNMSVMSRENEVLFSGV